MSVATFFYFGLKPSQYKATAKISMYQVDVTGTDATKYKTVLEEKTLTRSLVESITSRAFVKTLYEKSELTPSDSALKDTGTVIQAEVVGSSNIVEVQLYNTNKYDLEMLSNNFVESLDSAPMTLESDLPFKVKVVDPPYVYNDPVNADPIKYAILTFIGSIILVSAIFYAIFAPDRDDDKDSRVRYV